MINMQKIIYTFKTKFIVAINILLIKKKVNVVNILLAIGYVS